MHDAKHAKAAQRDAARKLRAEGKSFVKIAQALGVSALRAKQLVQEAADISAALEMERFDASGPIEGQVLHDLIAWWQARNVPRRAAQALALESITTSEAALEWLRARPQAEHRPQLGQISIAGAIDALTGGGSPNVERGELLLTVFGSPLPGAGQWVAIPADDSAKQDAVRRLEALGALESKPAVMVRRLPHKGT
jgi:hypothetical protein